MTTKQPRLNVTLSEEAHDILSMLAERDDKSVSAIAREMIQKGLELEEDLWLSELAEEREKQTTRWLTHDEFWKDV